MSKEEVEKRFIEGLRNARTFGEWTAAFAWREQALKHPKRQAIIDALGAIAMMFCGIKP